VDISGKFDTRLQSIFLRIGTQVVPKACLVLNSTFTRCLVSSNADTSIKFELSYNMIEWYSTVTNFTFLPCEPGYGTSSYSEPCQICPLGQFKASRSITTCDKCPMNTYSDKLGSTNCTACPSKMKSPGKTTGLTSVDQCVCVENTMVHPTHGMCVDCPIGAICNPENVTLPRSQEGWWFSKENITIFYLCHPKVRCLPDTPDNCTEGYEGLRCGTCADGFYKSKLVCKKCNNREITALSLVLAAFLATLIMIIAGLFIFVTSTKMSQMTSISITFGYWQIISTFTAIDLKWPGAVEGTLSAASATNFNVIFLYLTISLIFSHLSVFSESLD
jgi:hypothetical protein